MIQLDQPIWKQSFRSDLESFQFNQLKYVLSIVADKVKFYQQKFKKYKIDLNKIENEMNDLNFIRELPFTTKEDLKNNYPFGLFAVPKEKIVRLHATSGTTADPITVGYTKKDIENWTVLTSRVLTAAGVTSRDVVQILFGYGFFTGGLGFHYGAEHVGSLVLPASTGQTISQIKRMKDFGTTTLLGTPSYLLYLSDVIKEEGISLRKLSLTQVLCGAEAWSEEMRMKIESGLQVKAYDNYGLTELTGPGVAYECQERCGLHVNEDHYLVEVVDPKTGDPVPDGEKGELVFTTLQREAMPLIRYRTGDIAHLIPEPCDCGRTFKRISRITGRTDDMIIVRGVNIYPSKIEAVLLSQPDVEPYYQIDITQENGSTLLGVQVEVLNHFITDERKNNDLTHTLGEKLREAIGIKPMISLVNVGSLERYEGKANRVKDYRKYPMELKGV